MLTSAGAVSEWLAKQSGGQSAAGPLGLKLNFGMGTMTAESSGWRELLAAINTAGKFVTLDLSACAMTGTEFNPDATVTTGKDKITGIVLPTGATGIADGTSSASTFAGFTSLKSVTGANVTDIGEWAFGNCTRLTSVSFPAATFIEDDAFSGCTGLISASFPVAETIGLNAFRDCTGLTSVSFPEVTTIGFNAFFGCTGLTSVSFPVAETISNNAFSDCTGLISASFPVAETINYDAFFGCTRLTSVSFPSAATVMGNPFFGCTALTSITLTDSGGALSVLEDGKALILNGTELVAYPSASGDVTLSTIPIIGTTAFRGCTGLTSVSFPAATTIGNSAFYGCTGLSTLDIPGVTNIGQYAFANTGTTELTITMGSTAPTLGNGMFYGVDAPKAVIVNVPFSAEASYNDSWQTDFKEFNDNITLSITTR